MHTFSHPAANMRYFCETTSSTLLCKVIQSENIECLLIWFSHYPKNSLLGAVQVLICHHKYFRTTNEFCAASLLIQQYLFYSLSTEIADQCTAMSSSYPASVHRHSTIQMEQQEPSYNDRIVRENSRLPPDGREYPAQINSKFEKQHTTTTSSTTTKRFVKFIVIVSSSFSRCDRPTDGRGVASSLNK